RPEGAYRSRPRLASRGRQFELSHAFPCAWPGARDLDIELRTATASGSDPQPGGRTTAASASGRRVAREPRGALATVQSHRGRPAARSPRYLRVRGESRPDPPEG